MIKISNKGKRYFVKSSWKPFDDLIYIKINKKDYLLQFDKLRENSHLTYLDHSVDFNLIDKFSSKFDKYMLDEEDIDLSKFLLAPMPGMIVSINVKEGQKIKSGENILILEAMKMENMITADKDKIIKKINIKPGDAVEVDQKLIEFDD